MFAAPRFVVLVVFVVVILVFVLLLWIGKEIWFILNLLTRTHRHWQRKKLKEIETIILLLRLSRRGRFGITWAECCEMN